MIYCIGVILNCLSAQAAWRLPCCCHLNRRVQPAKTKKAYHSYEHRKLILETIRYVDEVIPENSWDQKVRDVADHNIDVFVMGDDWEGKFDFLKDQCEVIYLPRTEGISTTQIKKKLPGCNTEL